LYQQPAKSSPRNREAQKLVVIHQFDKKLYQIHNMTMYIKKENYGTQTETGCRAATSSK
jgi:hypothetical protein